MEILSTILRFNNERFFYSVEVPRVEFLSTVLWIDEGDDHGLKVRAYFYIKGEVV